MGWSNDLKWGSYLPFIENASYISIYTNSDCSDIMHVYFKDLIWDIGLCAQKRRCFFNLFKLLEKRRTKWRFWYTKNWFIDIKWFQLTFFGYKCNCWSVVLHINSIAAVRYSLNFMLEVKKCELKMLATRNISSVINENYFTWNFIAWQKFT